MAQKRVEAPWKKHTKNMEHTQHDCGCILYNGIIWICVFLTVHFAVFSTVTSQYLSENPGSRWRQEILAGHDCNPKQYLNLHWLTVVSGLLNYQA
jgi:hypothetical protein